MDTCPGNVLEITKEVEIKHGITLMAMRGSAVYKNRDPIY